MKRNYEKPAIEVVEIEIEGAILSSSDYESTEYEYGLSSMGNGGLM